MLSWFSKQAFDSLWALVWHFGIIGFVFFAALAWAYFIPVGKRLALLTAICALVMFFTAGIYTKLGADYVQAKWDAANTAAVTQATQARAKAVKSVAHPHASVFGGVRHDQYDRDSDKPSGASGVPTHNLFQF